LAGVLKQKWLKMHVDRGLLIFFAEHEMLHLLTRVDTELLYCEAKQQKNHPKDHLSSCLFRRNEQLTRQKMHGVV
jgi:homoserine trans-succinylase